MSAKSFRERLFGRVKETENGCLEFTGSKNPKGYGQLVVQAHRLSWLLERGDISDALILMHTCDNPACCNVEHLIPGTDKENKAQSIQRGRAYTPPRQTHCKRGHSLDDAIVTKNGRRCRTCYNTLHRERRLSCG